MSWLYVQNTETPKITVFRMALESPHHLFYATPFSCRIDALPFKRGDEGQLSQNDTRIKYKPYRKRICPSIHRSGNSRRGQTPVPELRYIEL